MADERREIERHWLDTRELDLSTRFDVLVAFQYGRAFLEGTLTDFHRRAYAGLETGADALGGAVAASDCVRRFHELLVCVARDGFDEAHPVAVDPRLRPLGAADRVAACMAANRPLCVARFDSGPESDRSYRYYRERGMSPEYMDFAAAALPSRVPGLRAAILCGAQLHRKRSLLETLGAAGSLYYEKTIELSETGKENLMRLMGAGEGETGLGGSGSLAARGRPGACFPSGSPATASLVLFRPSLSDDDRCGASMQLRDHGIHLSRSPEETRRLGRCALSPGGLHLLNHRRYRRFPRFERSLAAFEEKRAASGIDREQVLLVGSSILSIYGIRDARDLDVLVAPGVAERAGSRGLEPSNALWERYGFDVRELLYDPSKHFFQHGYECVRLDELVRLKERRGEAKDRVDLALIEQTLKTGAVSRARLARLRLLALFHARLTRLRSHLARVLVRLGLRTPRKRNPSYDVETTVS